MDIWPEADGMEIARIVFTDEHAFATTRKFIPSMISPESKKPEKAEPKEEIKHLSPDIDDVKTKTDTKSASSNQYTPQNDSIPSPGKLKSMDETEIQLSWTRLLPEFEEVKKDDRF